MSTPSGPPEPPKPAGDQSGGINVSGGSLGAGRDVAGRDIAGRDIVHGDVITQTRTGFSASEVQRLILLVGGLVFFTAACFFSGGIVLGLTAFSALDRTTSSPEAARAMQAKINAVNQLRPGQSGIVEVSEDEASSYLRFILGPQIGLSDGRLRLLDGTGKFIVAGNLSSVGGSRIAAIFQPVTGNAPLKLESMAVQVLPTGNSSFGWLPLPTNLAQPVVDQVNAQIGSRATLNDVRGALPNPPDPKGEKNTWTLRLTRR